MRSNNTVRFINSILLITAILSLTTLTAFAQETQETVVDEVIAQINEDVITLSQIKRQMQFVIDSLIQQGKTKEAAEKEVEEKKGQLIANIIKEELIIQRGKEVGLDKEVEARINQRFREQMVENNFKSLDELFKAMKAQGVSPDSLRNVWRPQLMRELVYGELVDRPLYLGITDKQLKEYYAKNAAKFKKEETVTISEIFLAFAGKDEAELLVTANQIVNRARNGEEFEKLVIEFSDRPNKEQTKGKAGIFKVPQLDKLFAEPLKDMKVGGITDPIKMDVGLEIIRLDERTAASDESSFDETTVRQAIWQERAPAARETFWKKLKEEAYIKIREEYRPIVNPFLNSEPVKEDTTASK